MKNILAENMLRFGPKNLSESDRSNLQRLMEQVTGLAQGDAVPFTGLKFSISSGDNPGNMHITNYTANLTFTGGNPVIEEIFLAGPKGKEDTTKDKVVIKIKNAAFSCNFFIYKNEIATNKFTILDAKSGVKSDAATFNFETSEYNGVVSYTSKMAAYLVDSMTDQKYSKAKDVFADVAWVKTARAAIPAAAAPTTTAPATTTPTKP